MSFKKKIIFNIITVLLIFLLFDIVFFYIHTLTYAKWDNFSNFLEYYIEFYSRIPSNKVLEDRYIFGTDDAYRKVINENFPQKPIVLFGCSYVYGYKLDKEDTFSKILGDYTQRPIYNRALSGFGIQHMIYQLQSPKFYDIIPEPEYIIYVFIQDHVRRLYIPSHVSIMQDYDIFYKSKNNDLVLKIRKYPNQKNIVFNSIQSLYYWKKAYNVRDNQNAIFLKQHFLKVNELLKEHWPNTKFIILSYTRNDTFEKIKPELEKAGIIVMDRYDFAPYDEDDEEYCLSKTDPHPNRKAWNYLVPRLVKEIEKY